MICPYFTFTEHGRSEEQVGGKAVNIERLQIVGHFEYNKNKRYNSSQPYCCEVPEEHKYTIPVDMKDE